MAITRVSYHILKRACEQGVIPKGGSLLELGEANYYGDFPVEEIITDVEAMVEDEAERRDLIARLKNESNPIHFFDVAKVIYRLLFDAKKMVAIDLNGTETAIPADLNEPVPMDEVFDITINNGTAEHVFNIGQVFKTVHERTAVNGVILHEAPFTGWYNHGFYNLQPTLYYDIATANNYGLMGVFCCEHIPPKIIQIDSPQHLLEFVEKKEIPANAVLFVMMKKLEDAPFKYPMQGYYDGRLDEQQKKAWEMLRTS